MEPALPPERVFERGSTSRRVHRAEAFHQDVPSRRSTVLVELEEEGGRAGREVG